MIIKKEVFLNQEVEIPIFSEDIELIFKDDPEAVYSLRKNIDLIYKFLNKMPDNVIDKLTNGECAKVHKFFLEQAEKFKPVETLQAETLQAEKDRIIF
ncbi:MAG: hypothetical protein A3K77_00730 [Euryarchaeota archaeon RBG_13_31_8]|nr:MAG: hypothetical protein A3K77_00730 [Euryarchaeota archaeon RBG_13_31_8]